MRVHRLWVLLMVTGGLAGCQIFGGSTPTETLIDRLASSDATDRWAAEADLIALGAAGVEPLTQTLANGERAARRHAAFILGAIARGAVPGSAEAAQIKPIADALTAALADEDADVVIQALGALGPIGSAEQLEPVADRLRNHLDLAVKHQAAETLVLLGPGAEGPLVRIGTDRAAPVYCRVLAVQALAEVSGSAEGARALLLVLTRTGHPALRAAAEEALATVARRDRVLASQLARGPFDQGSALTDSVARTLARLGPVFVGPGVFQRLLGEVRSAEIRAALIRSLARTQVGRRRLRPGGVRIIMQVAAPLLAREKEAEPLAATAWLMGRLGGDEEAKPMARDVVGGLIELLGHAALPVRQEAVAALRGLTGQRFGYQPAAPAEERVAAQAQWAHWQKSEPAP